MVTTLCFGAGNCPLGVASSAVLVCMEMPLNVYDSRVCSSVPSAHAAPEWGAMHPIGAPWTHDGLVEFCHQIRTVTLPCVWLMRPIMIFMKRLRTDHPGCKPHNYLSIRLRD